MGLIQCTTLHAATDPRTVFHERIPSLGIVRISLPQGLSTIVDEDDYPLICRYRWTTAIHNGAAYATATIVLPSGVKRAVKMHRLIVLAPKGVEVDHVDLDTLNNRRGNLRHATRNQNSYNKPLRKDNRSGFKGVHFHRVTGRWLAEIYADGKQHYLGLFDTAQEAGHAYDEAAIRLHGTYARLNFPR